MRGVSHAASAAGDDGREQGAAEQALGDGAEGMAVRPPAPMRPWRMPRAAAVGAVLGLILAVQVLYFQRGFVPGDAFVYLAAGERLNDGHLLYALSPGDRPVDIHPPYWWIPFVSPPLLAVLWRPLALLGEAAPYCWWVLGVAALLTSVAMLLRRRPLLTALALLVLSVPVVYEVGVGNVNAFLLFGFLTAWRAFAGGRPSVSGSLVAVAAALKVTPIMAAWWAIAVGGRRAAVGVLITVAVAAAVSLGGAGLANHLAYIEALTSGAVGFSPLSLGGMLRFAGLPEPAARVLVWVAAFAAVLLIWKLRRRPDRSFQAAVVAMIAASPAVSINWFVLLLALLAPVAWPVPRRPGVTPSG